MHQRRRPFAHLVLGGPQPAELVQFGLESGQGPKCRSLSVSLPFDSLCEFVEAGAYVPERSKLHAALALHLLRECSEGGACVSQRLKLRVALPFYVIWQFGGYSPEITRPAMRTTHEASSNARLASASV